MKNSPFIILFLSIVCFFPGAPSASIFKDEFPEEIKEYANVFKPLRVQYEPWITTKNKKTFQPLWNSLKTLLSNKNTNDHVKSYLRQGQGHILYKLKEFQKAEKFFTSAIKLAEKVPDHYYYYSLNLLEMNDRNKAIEQVETFITLHKAYETNSKISFKKNIKSNYFKACCFLYISYHIQSKQVDKGKTVKKFLKNSLKYLKELLRLSDYKDNMYKLFIANTYQELGDYKHAEMYYLKSTKNIIDQEDKEKNSCNLIRCYYNQENKEEEMKKEIEKLRDFKFPLPVFKLSYELQTKGFKTYSNEVHKIAVKIRESKKQSILFAQHYCKEGFFYQRTKQFDEAIKNYILTISIEGLQKKRGHQLRFISYCKLGEIYTSKNKYKEAEENLQKAMKIYPTAADPYHLLLYCFMKQGRRQKIEQFVRKNYLKIKQIGQLYVLCFHFDNKGDDKFADQLFNRAQKFSKKQTVSYPVEIYYRIGCYFQKRKRHSQAITNYKIYIDRNETDKIFLRNVYNNLGSIYILEKKYRKAEKFLLKAIGHRSNDGNIYYNLARLHDEQGHTMRARNYYLKALELGMSKADNCLNNLKILVGEIGDDRLLREFYKKMLEVNTFLNPINTL